MAGRAAERVHRQASSPRGADGIHIDDIVQVLDIGQDEILLREWSLPSSPLRTARASRWRLPFASSSFARSWIHFVTSVSAGPPLGGLYLKPPSSGGLCDGVITMPSAR